MKGDKKNIDALWNKYNVLLCRKDQVFIVKHCIYSIMHQYSSFLTVFFLVDHDG